MERDFQAAGLTRLHDWSVENGTLVLTYFLGQEAGYLFVVMPNHPPRLVKLEVDQALAHRLGLSGAGPLTTERMQSALDIEGTSLLELLSRPATALTATDRLAALWTALIPADVQPELVGGRVRRLVVVPDGALALLPFETLVTESGKQPKYLLDAGPPILYAPSATVLLNLLERPTVKGPADLKPVLTVGNPRYQSNDIVVASRGTSVPNELSARSRYSTSGGQLAALPFSGVESGWVAEVFGKIGVAVGKLLQGDATESNVRFNVAGRRVVHLACHGLTDQKYGNFFGALALTPGPKGASDPADDGFLTLPEIYELNLKSCELAILSACQTNYGPQQKGEGIWALSRGFLVSGARRVVASNWLVDDEAAASLVSVFCGDLVKAEGKGETPDYAAALHRAKKWVRGQQKWSSPYYWGTFVLLGPN
jgi:CHAT domain-containing protein